MARRCVRSRKLENEEAKDCYWVVAIRPQWVVMRGKQMANNSGKFRPNMSADYCWNLIREIATGEYKRKKKMKREFN